jgi:hypothetical protein
MKKALTISLLVVGLVVPSVALASVTVGGSRGLVVTNSGCSDKVGNGYAYIKCTTGHSTVVQWSTPYSENTVALHGTCSYTSHYTILRYWRSGGRDRVNVKFWGPESCTISSVVFK